MQRQEYELAKERYDLRLKAWEEQAEQILASDEVIQHVHAMSDDEIRRIEHYERLFCGLVSWPEAQRGRPTAKGWVFGAFVVGWLRG